MSGDGIKLCECGCGESAPIAKETSHSRRKGEAQRFVRGHMLRGVWTGRKHTPESIARMSEVKMGSKHSAWKGGVLIVRGRRMVYVGRDHPLGNVKGYAFEHRLVMSERLGRWLESHEHVHHINLDPLDNRIDNLVVLNNSQHRRIHSLIRHGSAEPLLALAIVLGEQT